MRSFGVLLVRPIFIILEIKIPGIIRTSNHTVSASYTSVVIDDDNTVITLIGCLYRAYLGTGRFITMITE